MLSMAEEVNDGGRQGKDLMGQGSNYGVSVKRSIAWEAAAFFEETTLLCILCGALTLVSLLLGDRRAKGDDSGMKPRNDTSHNCIHRHSLPLSLPT